MDTDALRGSYADPRKGETPIERITDELRLTWRDLEPKTRAGYEAILRKWLIGDDDPLRPGRPCRFKGAKVGAITAKSIQEFVYEVGEVREPNTLRRIYGVLSATMRLAVERGYIVSNPCDSVKLPSKKRAGVRRSHLYLEGHELRALAEAIGEPWSLPVYIAGSCGLRAGELWALRRRDIDLLHGELIVRYALKPIESSALEDDDKGLIVGPPKSAASRRRISIPSSLVPMVESHLATGGVRSPDGFAVARAVDEVHAELSYSADASDPDRLMFVSATGRPVRHGLFYRRTFRPAVKAALPERLQGFRWHDLRHTCAALSLAANPSLAAVKERLGHENIQTTVDLYGKRVPSVDAALAEAVGGAIFDGDIRRSTARLATGE